MAYLPPGYNNLSRAGQRAGSELLSIGIRNIASEFAPELAPIVRKLHIPRVVSTWWTQQPKAQPGRP
jgi:hypothetical protein